MLTNPDFRQAGSVQILGHFYQPRLFDTNGKYQPRLFKKCSKSGFSCELSFGQILTLAILFGKMKQNFFLQYSSTLRTSCDGDEDGFKSISYENILAAFIILPFGLFIAIATLGFEKMKRRKQMIFNQQIQYLRNHSRKFKE